MAGASGQANKMSLDGLLELFVPRAQCLNWEHGWDYRSHRRHKRIVFAEVANIRRLRRYSDFCERDYLLRIQEMRDKFVAARVESGASPEEARRFFYRRLCQRDLYYLSKFVLGYDKLRFHLHKGMCDSVNDLPPGYRGLREFPRDAFKTTCMSISFMVQQVIRNPNVRILLKSNAEGNASKKLSEAKNHFTKEESRLLKLFPEFAPKNEKDKGSGTYWKCPAATSVQEDGTLCASGVGSSKVSQHFDIIIGDDFWDEKSVTSLETSTKTNKELDGLEYLLVSPAAGIILFIGTRFSHDDPTSRLLGDERYHCIIVSGILPNGREVFPESMPISMYLSQARSSLYVFSCQVMLNPTTEDSGFRREWFRYLPFSEIKRDKTAGRLNYRTVIVTDAAVDGKSTSDNVMIGVILVDSFKRRTLVECVREKMEPSVFINTLCNYWDKWQPEFVVRQKTALETTLQSFFRERNRQRLEAGKSAVRFYDYSLAKREKKRRITAALQPLFQEGVLYFDPGLQYLEEIERECLEHPNSKNDDMLDGLAMLDDPVVSRIPGAPSGAVDTSPREADEQPQVPQGEDAWRKERAARLFRHGRSGVRAKVRNMGRVTL